MRRWMSLCETLDFDFGPDFTRALKNGKEVGWFTHDNTYGDDVSVHATVDAPHRRQGIAKRAYDALEQHLSTKGKRLIPSDRLSFEAYQMWLKRKPEAVRDYREGQPSWGMRIFYSPRGFTRFGEKPLG